MAYFGKEFTFDREENFDAYLKAVASTPEEAKEYQEYKPTQKIEKVGDSYKLTLKAAGDTQEIVFKSGVPFVDKTEESANTTITVDGDTFTQVLDYGSEGNVTFKREFSADQLKMTFTCSVWDGVAYRYYKA